MGNASADYGVNERAQYFLKVLIERYIQDGHPVGSRTLARDSGLDLTGTEVTLISRREFTATYAGGQTRGPPGNTTVNGDLGADVFGNGGNLGFDLSRRCVSGLGGSFGRVCRRLCRSLHLLWRVV